MKLIDRAQSLVKNIREPFSNLEFYVDLLEPYAKPSTLQYAAGRKAECIADLKEIISLVSGADATKLEKFEPLVWTPELMVLLLNMCVIHQEVGSGKEASTCKETCKRLYGVVSGLGFEAVSIDDVIHEHKKRMGLNVKCHGWECS